MLLQPHARHHHQVIKMLRFNGTPVPPGYEVSFQRALWAFRHCRVFCPTARRLVHLAPLPPGGLGAADVEVAAAVPELLGPDGGGGGLAFLGPDLEEGVAQGVAAGEGGTQGGLAVVGGADGQAGCGQYTLHCMGQVYGGNSSCGHTRVSSHCSTLPRPCHCCPLLRPLGYPDQLTATNHVCVPATALALLPALFAMSITLVIRHM
jgi:hypothetical protein